MTNRRYRIVLTCFALLLVVSASVLWYTVYLERDRPFRVVFLDVGQGDAIFIESPAGRQMLIDGGRGKQVLRELGKVMPFYDRSIDVVVATHPDADHIGGLPHVLARYDVDAVVRTGLTSDTKAFAAFHRRIKQEGADAYAGRRGMVIRLGSGVHFDILFPDRNPQGMDPNDASIVGRLVYNDRSYLLSGDASTSIERYLVLDYGRELASSILKAGHHGSRTSSARSFVSAVDPADVVISAGSDNPYGHPHQSVVTRFRRLGARIHRTSESRVVFRSD